MVILLAVVMTRVAQTIVGRFGETPIPDRRRLTQMPYNRRKIGCNLEECSARGRGCGGHPLRRDLESFDLFLDFVGESRRAGAVYDPVIKCERERNYLGAFVSVFVKNQFKVGSAHKQRPD